MRKQTYYQNGKMGSQQSDWAFEFQREQQGQGKGGCIMTITNSMFFLVFAFLLVVSAEMLTGNMMVVNFVAEQCIRLYMLVH